MNPKRLEWDEKIKNWQSSEKSVAAWCREHKIACTTFHYWKKIIRPKNLKENKQLFLEVKEKSFSEIDIELQIKNFTVRLPKGFDEETLRRCLIVLKAF